MHEHGPYVEFDTHTPSESVMQEIVSAVSEAKGCDATELRPIAEVLNPEAVETVLRRGDGNVSLGFEYEGGFVRVTESSVEYEPHD